MVGTNLVRRFALVALALTLSLAGTRLARACDPCPAPGGEIFPTTTCQYPQGRTDRACTAAVHPVDVAAGETYVFTFCDFTCSGAGADFDTVLTLYDASCNVIDVSFDVCNGAEIWFDAFETATYRIEVTGDD